MKKHTQKTPRRTAPPGKDRTTEQRKPGGGRWRYSLAIGSDSSEIDRVVVTTGRVAVPISAAGAKTPDSREARRNA